MCFPVSIEKNVIFNDFIKNKKKLEKIREI